MDAHVKFVFTESFYFLQKCYHFLFQRYRLEHYTVSSNWLALGAVAVFTVLSLSRSVALFRGAFAHKLLSEAPALGNKKVDEMRFFFLGLQATMPPWICIQSFTESPRIRLFIQSPKADLSVCVWAKSGTASQAASYCRTSQYPGYCVCAGT